MFNKNTNQILKEFQKPTWNIPAVLCLKGKVTEKHAQEIEEIIQVKLHQAEYRGLMKGKKIWKQHINKGIRKKKDKIATIRKLLENNGLLSTIMEHWIWGQLKILDDIKKLNK